jgi:hypothetical protein
MNPARKSAEVVDELLRAMANVVTSYHPTVGRTSSTVEGLIQGTSFFPGGAGLWRGRQSGGVLPEYFPPGPLMFVGHNFDSQRNYDISLARGGEVEGQFWTRLLRILEAARVAPEACFFTNALMGLKPGKAEGAVPSVPGYKEECQEFLKRQIEIVQPCALVALGSDATRHLRHLKSRYVALKHPSNWDFRPLATRDVLLLAEGRKLREFLNSIDGQVAHSSPVLA